MCVKLFINCSPNEIFIEIAFHHSTIEVDLRDESEANSLVKISCEELFMEIHELEKFELMRIHKCYSVIVIPTDI